MSARNKTIKKGNSNQSGEEVHRKTMGHVEAVSKAMQLGKRLAGKIGQINGGRK